MRIKWASRLPELREMFPQSLGFIPKKCVNEYHRNDSLGFSSRGWWETIPHLVITPSWLRPMYHYEVDAVFPISGRKSEKQSNGKIMYWWYMWSERVFVLVRVKMHKNGYFVRKNFFFLKKNWNIELKLSLFSKMNLESRWKYWIDNNI